MRILANTDTPTVTTADLPGVELQDLSEFRFRLANALQTSLDLHETLANFYQMLQQVIRCSGIEYRMPSKDLHLTLGTYRAHRANYALKNGQQSIGEMTFFRGAKFSESDLSTLESLLAMLMLPLRNALLYRDALENSLRDGLTSVGNRAGLELTLQRELKLSKRHSRPLSLLVADIDAFKQINDSLGHEVGDQLLIRVASAIKSALRDTDQVFRYGGDEFVVILGNTAAAEAKAVAERLRRNVARLALVNSAAVAEHATVSIGLSSSIAEDTRDTLFKKADQALYRAKSSGRNRVICDV